MKEYVTGLTASGNETLATLRDVPDAKALESAEKMGGAAPVAERQLRPGDKFKFSVTGTRRCVGSSQFSDAGGFAVVPCRTARVIEKGIQCYPCSRADQSKLIHNTPREKASDELVLYLDVPHFLYIAGFADGTVKVGTSRTVRGVRRWVEQGAVAALRIADFEDGWAVRAAENLVSQQGDLTQAVRTGRKSKAYTAALTASQIVDMVASAARNALDILKSEDLRGTEPAEAAFADDAGAEGGTLDFEFDVPGTVGWVNPVALPHLGEGNAPAEGGEIDITEGSHSFQLVDTVGSSAFVKRLEDIEMFDGDATKAPLYVINWAALKGREINTTTIED